ncbi:MAG: hypothetical protein FWG73_02950 [Planctomycetaceae bacterium]|nr:hypothetical protein [Planctomycetaceae bacterium]
MSSIRSGRNIDSALRKKGFVRSADSDHVVYRFFSTEKELLARTKMSHGMMGSSISVPLIAVMARQLHLTSKQFLDFVDCPMNEAEYREILLESGNRG